jgi:hypothetical protein
MNNLKLALLIAALALASPAFSNRASAEPCSCAHCGCRSECMKVCRLVPEEKKVEILCYGVKCEDFCVPNHGCRDCRHCDPVCDDCENCKPDEPRSKPKYFIWFDWIPNGAKMYTRHKLMRKSETAKVPSYKWVVEDMCPDCAAKFVDDVPMVAEAPATADAPVTR